MADALCGPSNPLQQFKQQTQLDRTIQQDRLRARLSPTQGFRSQNPNAGVLDPEFEAFQAGVPLSDLPQFHQQPPAFAGPSQTPSWAADFQRMQVSSPPVFQQQHVPHASPVTANWANGFQQHIAQNGPRAQTSAHSPQAFQQMARYGTSGLHGFQNTFAQPSFAQHVHTKGKEPVTEKFDDAAFEAAFDQAREDMLAEADAMEAEKPAYEAGVSTADFEVDHEAHVDKVRRQAMAAIRGHLRTLSQEREAQMARDVLQPEILERLEDEPLIEEAIIEEQVEQEDQSQQEDDDALAATAKELLEKVEHNKSEKFKNSQFLNLMRKLRDREMKVEGDQMVETVRSNLNPRIHSHDSAYGSGTTTPVSLSHNLQRPQTLEVHAYLEHGYDEEHKFDHWESPYH